jgi:TatD DNase family protein
MQDIHTHLYWQSYDADREEVLKRAWDNGVKEMFVIGCTIKESEQSVALAEKYGDVYAAVGVHPHEFNVGGSVHEDSTFSFVEELRELLNASEKIIAIGECGLDYFSHDKTKVISEGEKELQKKGFELQLELALEKNLPVIVHCREAYWDMLEIFQRYPDASAFILHCYMGDTEVTREFLKLPNVFFSFTANITYPIKKALRGTKDDLTETVKLIPLERLFTETDCPFLTPQSKRGERNEPAYVEEVVAQVATIQGKTFEEVEKRVTENVKRIFNL